LVGHSYGGLILRYFAHAYPEDVAGLVFVDPVCVTEWGEITDERRRVLARGVALSKRGAFLARWGVVGWSLRLLMGGSRHIPKLVAKVSSGQAQGLAGRLVGEVSKLPREVWPLLQQQWSEPKCFEAMAEYLRYLPLNAQTATVTSGLGSLPVTVISSVAASPAELEEHRALAALSSRGAHVIAEGSGHWIPFDRPDVVLGAVQRVLAEIRTESSSTANE
jgi:pimeloyl-ACP methyl ester carboxylesterase